MTGVNGISYTWDNNGNLLDDGVNTYTYDPANRLSVVNGPLSDVTYAYNGLGDRLQTTIDSNPATTYVMDYNVGLTQVLDDGTTAYIYGNDRIAQENTTTQYFLGDALGSVRQVTNLDGNIVLAKAYDPYGVNNLNNGTASTNYGFTGEHTEPTGDIYLRARHYSPGVGRFVTRDTWGGTPYQPISYNKWAYSNASPVMYTDPSGRFCPFCLIPVVILLGLTACSTPSTPPEVDLWISHGPELKPDPRVENRKIQLITISFKPYANNPTDYALVQFVKGNATKLSDGSYPKVQMFGERVDANFPEWHIDSQGTDPVYYSWSGPPRWNYDDMGDNEYSMSDGPNVDPGYKVSLDFNTCIYHIVDVPEDGPSVNAEVLMASAIKCVAWEFKLTYKDNLTIEK